MFQLQGSLSGTKLSAICCLQSTVVHEEGLNITTAILAVYIAIEPLSPLVQLVSVAAGRDRPSTGHPPRQVGPAP